MVYFAGVQEQMYLMDNMSDTFVPGLFLIWWNQYEKVTDIYTIAHPTL